MASGHLFLTAALLPYSALYTALFIEPSNDLRHSKCQETVTCSRVKLRETVICNFSNQQPATSSHSPDHSHKLCWLTNSRAGRPVGAQNKSQPYQAMITINSLLISKEVSITKRSKHSQCKRSNSVWLHGHAVPHLRRGMQHYTGPA